MGRLAAIVALLTALSLGCDQKLHDLAAPYVGTWVITSGQDTFTCVSGASGSTPVTGSVVVGFGSQELLLDVRDTNHGMCVWTLEVSSTAAILHAGPSCAASTETSNATVVPRDYTMTLVGSNGASVTSNFDWTILDDTCHHVQTETLLLMTPG